MKDLNYEPSVARRGRRRKGIDGIRTHNIALLHLRAASTISTSVLSCVQQMLAERNLNLIFAHVERADALPQAIRSGNIDGILGYGELPADFTVAPALRRIPAVWMMSRFTAGSADVWGDRVKPDNGAIGRIAAEYLLSRGHRDLAFFNAQPRLGVYVDRGETFCNVARNPSAVGAAMPAAQSVEMLNAEDIHPNEGMSRESMQHAAEQLVKLWQEARPRPTGVFVPVDRIALRVYRQLERVGASIGPGKEIEIVSCDNEPELLAMMTPPPASIDINRRAIARLAVERLFWRMKHGTSFPSVTVTVSPTLPEWETAPS